MLRLIMFQNDMHLNLAIGGVNLQNYNLVVLLIQVLNDCHLMLADGRDGQFSHKVHIHNFT